MSVELAWQHPGHQAENLVVLSGSNASGSLEVSNSSTRPRLTHKSDMIISLLYVMDGMAQYTIYAGENVLVSLAIDK